MRGPVIAMVVIALMQSTVARADGSPPWTDRATRIVARIHVDERQDTSAPETRIPTQDGIGFFVGFKGQTAYLVTAGHVIWPNGLPAGENVKLDVALRGCDASVPAVANSVQASPRTEFDVALVKIHLADIPNDVHARCQEVLEHLEELPRHIVDPDGDSLSLNTRAWLIGPGVVFEGRVPRPIIFQKYVGNALQFAEPAFTLGDSGSPIFSERGDVIGMAVADNALATKFSVILTKIDKDWEVPTNLVGPSSRLWFSDRLRGARLSIDRGPDVALELPHPAPLGTVGLKLRIDNSLDVTDTVNVEGTDMSCDVTMSRWLARQRRKGLYTTIGLGIVTVAALVVAKTSHDSFGQSPSRSSYDDLRLFNGIAIGTGSAALATAAATVVGHFSSDRTGITCRRDQR